MSNEDITFTWDKYFWTVHVRLPSWDAFRDRSGVFGSLAAGGTPGERLTPLHFSTVEDEEPMTPDDLASAKWVVENEAAVADALLASLVKEYPRLQEQSCYGVEEYDEFMPNVSSPEGFRSMIGLHSVTLHPLVKDGVPYIGFEFGCTWDDEHGKGRRRPLIGLARLGRRNAGGFFSCLPAARQTHRPAPVPLPATAKGRPFPLTSTRRRPSP